MSELPIPLLIIAGEHDEPYTHAAAEYMEKVIPSARNGTIEDAAHLPNLDHPGEFQRIVTTFLESISL